VGPVWQGFNTWLPLVSSFFGTAATYYFTREEKRWRPGGKSGSCPVWGTRCAMAAGVFGALGGPCIAWWSGNWGRV